MSNRKKAAPMKKSLWDTQTPGIKCYKNQRQGASLRSRRRECSASIYEDNTADPLSVRHVVSYLFCTECLEQHVLIVRTCCMLRPLSSFSLLLGLEHMVARRSAGARADCHVMELSLTGIEALVPAVWASGFNELINNPFFAEEVWLQVSLGS